jgi:hypothetical protein
MYGWWYLTIAAGFLLLAVERWINGGRGWMIALRVVIAAGFGMLAWAELRKVRR